MSFNVLDAVRSYLTPGLVSGVSLSLNESDSAVNKALAGLMPVTLSGFVAKANSNNNNAKDILEIVKTVYSENADMQIGNISNHSLHKGAYLVQVLFGDKLNVVTDSIIAYAGIKKESAMLLFGLTGSLIAGLLGKYVTDLNMRAASLASFLHSQKTNIMSMLPAELSGITCLLGLSKIGDTLDVTTTHTRWYESITTDESKPKKRVLLWMLVLAIILLAAIFFALKK